MSATIYGLMDRESANMVGTYPTRAAALEVVRDTIRRHGRHSRAVLSLALAREDLESPEGFIAAGDELAAMALRGFEGRVATG
jgi:hypothetical protein